MNATTHQQKNESVVSTDESTVTVPIIAFEDGRGDLTVHFETNPERPSEFAAASSLTRRGFVDAVSEFLDVSAFPVQEPHTGPQPVEVFHVTVDEDRCITHLAAAGDYLVDGAAETINGADFTTEVR